MSPASTGAERERERERERPRTSGGERGKRRLLGSSWCYILIQEVARKQKLTENLLGVAVAATLLAEADDHVDEPAVVLDPLLGPANLVLLLLLLGDLRSLVPDLTGTCETSVNLACGGKRSARIAKIRQQVAPKKYRKPATV